MPMYEFERLVDGKMVERFYEMRDVPDIGGVIVVEGRALRRIVSSGVQVSAEVATVVHGYPYVSHSLPRKLDGCECDPQGKPIVRSRAHERNIASEHGYERD